MNHETISEDGLIKRPVLNTRKVLLQIAQFTLPYHPFGLSK